MKKKILLGFIFIIVIGFIGGIVILLSNMNNESEKLKKNAELIIAEHSKFEEYFNDFNEMNMRYHNEVYNNLFIEEVDDNYSNWISVLDSYRESVLKIESMESFIRGNCFVDDYLNSDVKSKCELMVKLYEAAINRYVSDVENFNNIISIYNESVSSSDSVPLYDLEGRDGGIDFNDDGILKEYVSSNK